MGFEEVIKQQMSEKKATNWEGTVIEYLHKVKESPEIAMSAPGRVYNMVTKSGTSEIDPSFRIRGYDDIVGYNFFKDQIFGSYYGIADIMKFLHAASKRTETGRRILMLIGPVSSGKSTIAARIKRGLEEYSVPKYVLKDCPMNEEPLMVIPKADRPYWEEELGVKIDGELCPVCRHNIKEHHTDENGIIDWASIPVTQFQFSEQMRNGIGTFQPSDEKAQDISELIGSVNMSKLHMYGEADPRAYEYNGELQAANGGLIEYIEMLKCSTKFHYVLITIAQEQLIKVPRFPQTHIDVLLLAHTNQSEFDSFKSDPKNEALHDRIYPVFVPYNLRVRDEIKIYEKMIRESDFAHMHISPRALEVAAQFAVLTRLTESSKVSNLIEKMKIYNGESTKEFKKEEVDVKSLRQEGKANGEGMSGISPRFIINALNVAMGAKSKKECINTIDVIKALKTNFNHHIGISEEDVDRYINMLTGDKDSVASEYKEFAKEEVNMAFLYAYDEQAQALFDRYMVNATAFVKKDKVLDPLTEDLKDPDEKIMRSIEELIGVPENSKEEFRKGVFVWKADKLEQGEKFTYNDYDPLRQAIQKKLVGDLKNFVSLSLADTTTTDPKAKKKREKAMETLLEKGYCTSCANSLLGFVGEILRREE